MARKAGAENKFVRSGSAVARERDLLCSGGLFGLLLSWLWADSGCGTTCSMVKGRPAKASGAESFEKRVSKDVKNV
jgi:hypothetical protein